jgi:hypothetical protein
MRHLLGGWRCGVGCNIVIDSTQIDEEKQQVLTDTPTVPKKNLAPRHKNARD